MRWILEFGFFFVNFRDQIFPPGYSFTLMPHNRYICKELIVLDWEQLGNDPENNDLWLDEHSINCWLAHSLTGLGSSLLVYVEITFRKHIYSRYT